MPDCGVDVTAPVMPRQAIPCTLDRFFLVIFLFGLSFFLNVKVGVSRSSRSDT